MPARFGKHMDNIESFSKVIGVVVAKDTETAHAAAKLVKASPRNRLCLSRTYVVTLVLQVAYKDKEVPVLSIEEALKREGRVSRLSWEEVAHLSIFLDRFTWSGG